jgi:putative membrane protein
MKSPGKLKLTFYLLGFAGAALFTTLLIREGAARVMQAFVTPEWVILGIVAYHSIPIFVDAIAWWVLFPKSERVPLMDLFWMRWIGESISTLVPSAAIGGDIVRARLAALKGAPLATAAATVIVDVTLGVFLTAGFTILGLLLLVRTTGQTSFVRPTLFGVVIAVCAFGGFYIAQRKGMFGFVGRLISRLAGSAEWQSLVEHGETLDEKVRSLYGRRRGLLLCCVWTILSFVSAAGEIWIALYGMDLPASFVNALILQSTAFTIRSAAFAVPGAIGVQEGGYVFVGSLLGIPGESAFALSLIMRLRELGLGIPGLVTWQLIEGRRLLRERTAAASS